MAVRKTNKEIVAKIAELLKNIELVEAYKTRVKNSPGFEDASDRYKVMMLRSAEKAVQQHEAEIEILNWVLNDEPKNAVYNEIPIVI